MTSFAIPVRSRRQEQRLQQSVLAGHIGRRRGHGQRWLDCNDSENAVYPGAPEIDDGVDNRCPGDSGYGVVDELGDEAGFWNPDDNSELTWPELEVTTLYEAFRQSDDPELCISQTMEGTLWLDSAVPVTGDLFEYLIRVLEPFAGSLGLDSMHRERELPCP